MAELNKIKKQYLDKLLHGVEPAHRRQLGVLLGLPLVIAVLAVSVQLTQQQVRQQVEASGAELSFTGSAAADVAETPVLEVGPNDEVTLFMMMNTKGEEVTAVDLLVDYDETRLELQPSGRINPNKFGLMAVKTDSNGQVKVFGAPNAGVSWKGSFSVGNLQFKWKPGVAAGARAAVRYESGNYAVVGQTMEPQAVGTSRNIILVRTAAAVPPTNTPMPTPTPTPTQAPELPQLVVKQGQMTAETARFRVNLYDHVIYRLAQQDSLAVGFTPVVKVVFSDDSQLTADEVARAEVCGQMGGSMLTEDSCVVTVQRETGGQSSVGKYLMLVTELTNKQVGNNSVSCNWGSGWAWASPPSGAEVAQLGMSCDNSQRPGVVQQVGEPVEQSQPDGSCRLVVPSRIKAGEEINFQPYGELADSSKLINRLVVMYEGDVSKGPYESRVVNANKFGSGYVFSHVYTQIGDHTVALMYLYDNNTKQIRCEQNVEVVE